MNAVIHWQAFLCFQSIFIFYVIKWSPVKYGSVEYPFWAHGIGFVMSAASMLWIPGYAVYYIMTERGSLRDVGKTNFFPKPRLLRHRDRVPG